MSLNVEILEQSFAKVKSHTAEFASSFYTNLFTDSPKLQLLFANTNMQQQEEKLMMSLMLVLSNLRSPYDLKLLLKNLGERHVGYGVVQEHYPLIGAALLKTFESYLGTDWTPEVKQAWIDAYEAIAGLMLEGAKHVEETQTKSESLVQTSQPITNSQPPTPNQATVSASVSASTNSQTTSQSNQNSQPSVEPASDSQPLTPNRTTVSASTNSQTTSQSNQNLQPSVKPASDSQPLTPNRATLSNLNIKRLVLVFTIFSLLGVGFLYYYSNSKQDGKSIKNSGRVVLMG